ncbi:MAG: response regulator [Proteobacteria bacterium]|nr:response regulator [Pseudomonadota bacterium]
MTTPDSTPTPPKYTIVCVDDDPDMLAAVVRALRPVGYEILQTSNPVEALDLVALRDVAVLVSDYEMPEMNGVDLAAAARRVRPETVRVLMTGRKSLDTAVDGINQGEIFRYVQKPFELRTLRKAVEDAVERHVALLASAAEHEVLTRRERLATELEEEYPNITKVVHTDGVYEVPPLDIAALSGLGLDSIIAAART